MTRQTDLLKETWGIVKKMIGVFFIVLGIIGLFLPLLQGVLFIIIGLAFLGNKKLTAYIKNLFKQTKKN